MRAAGDKRWLRLLPDLTKNHNEQFVTGTNVRRIDVNNENYLTLLEQKYKTEDPSLMFNLGTTTSYPKPLEKLVWRYEVGQKVLLARRVDYTLVGRSNFEKPSLTGSFGPNVYTVTSRAGKNTLGFFIAPVYRLSSLDNTWIYERDLRPALFVEGEKSASASRKSERLLYLALRRRQKMQQQQQQRKQKKKKL